MAKPPPFGVESLTVKAHLMVALPPPDPPPPVQHSLSPEKAKPPNNVRCSFPLPGASLPKAFPGDIISPCLACASTIGG